MTWRVSMGGDWHSIYLCMYLFNNSPTRACLSHKTVCSTEHAGWLSMLPVQGHV